MAELRDEGPVDEEQGPEEWSTGDISMAIFVTLGRIYDMLTILAMKAAPEATGVVLALHEQGLLKGAPPSMSVPEVDESTGE